MFEREQRVFNTEWVDYMTARLQLTSAIIGPRCAQGQKRLVSSMQHINDFIEIGGQYQIGLKPVAYIVQLVFTHQKPTSPLRIGTTTLLSCTLTSQTPCLHVIIA